MSYAEVNCVMSFIEFKCIKHTHHVSVGATNSVQLTKKQQPTFEILLSQNEFF